MFQGIFFLFFSPSFQTTFFIYGSLFDLLPFLWCHLLLCQRLNECEDTKGQCDSLPEARSHLHAFRKAPSHISCQFVPKALIGWPPPSSLTQGGCGRGYPELGSSDEARAKCTQVTIIIIVIIIVTEIIHSSPFLLQRNYKEVGVTDPS